MFCRRARSSLRWAEQLTFDICLGNLPRETRVCFTLYAERKGTRTPVAWVAHRLFDFQLCLQQGVRYESSRSRIVCSITTNTHFDEWLNSIFRMWPSAKANPIGVCMDNPAKGNGAEFCSLKVAFPTFDGPIRFVSLHKPCT